MKHAYLIIAHNQFELLKKLISMLDYSNNDIYLFIDLKVSDSLIKNLNLSTNNANLFFVKRHVVFWGDYSQIQAEMALLMKATESYHDYYHLLSGVDLPIKRHCEIEDFFEKHKGLEFVAFDKSACENRRFENRIRYYYRVFDVKRADGHLLRLQQLIGINRIKNLDYKLMIGSNWFDITHAFAVYVCSKMSEPKFAHIFTHTNCGDEVFLQTILYNSRFITNVAEKEIRLIDWINSNGSSPAIITQAYWQQIQQSECIFARKFNIDVDSSIIEKIESQYGE